MLISRLQNSKIKDTRIDKGCIWGPLSNGFSWWLLVKEWRLIFLPMIFLTIIFHQMLQLTVSRPNILLIVADDLGFADVSWNNPKMKTPILQSLASEGIILDQFYAQPKCSPSRSALLTGIYPYKMSMQRGSIGDFRPTGLPTHLPTLPELLRSSGYSTHLIGKWHIGYCHHSYTPNYRGFDTFFGSLAQQSDHYSREHEINKYMGSGYDLWRNKNVSHDGKGMYSTHLWKQETVSLINSFNKSTPWFIELATTAPHTPYQVPDKYTRSYRRNMGRNSEEDEIVRKGMVTALDESIGEIISALKQAGNYEDTLIVFCSDNGAGSKEGNAPLRGKKGEIFEGGVRVPAMIHGAPLKRSSILSSGYKRYFIDIQNSFQNIGLFTNFKSKSKSKSSKILDIPFHSSI